VMPTCQEVFEACFWHGKGIPCCELYQVQRSELGYCFSFNSLTTDGAKHCPAWLDHDGDEEVKSQQDPECVLRRNMGVGSTTGLEVFLKSSPWIDTLASGQRDVEGVRVSNAH
ncbi:unnamed protein product, partial [Timema podura]|nr:unnamed protein product [Timema podura]